MEAGSFAASNPASRSWSRLTNCTVRLDSSGLKLSCVGIATMWVGSLAPTDSQSPVLPFSGGSTDTRVPEVVCELIASSRCLELNAVNSATEFERYRRLTSIGEFKGRVLCRACPVITPVFGETKPLQIDGFPICVKPCDWPSCVGPPSRLEGGRNRVALPPTSKTAPG